MKLVHEIFMDEEENVVEAFHSIQSSLMTRFPLTEGYSYEFYLTNFSYRVKVYKLEKPL